uniref:Ovule protein n=1 Tax=Heterorhabditis bacteriophora TaxID=37862 RepID=A0A1I7XG45_HETBA
MPFITSLPPFIMNYIDVNISCLRFHNSKKPGSSKSEMNYDRTNESTKTKEMTPVYPLICYEINYSSIT